ncbi:MAG: metallophosphatase [Candidatus Eremiobacteraeota bacterium]|nr:metallophosphatase [Candidatus Eremiobacteraeota bacterium]
MREREITIYHTSDLHNHRAALRRLSSLVDTRKDYLLLDSGDAIGGSSTLFSFSEPILDMMRDMGYGAMAIGNREFNYNRSVMKSRLRQAGFPVVSANLVDLRGKISGLFHPYTVLEKNGIKTGILGLTPVQYPENSLWERFFGFRFYSPYKAVNKYLPQVYTGCDVVIILSHLGFKADQDLAGVISTEKKKPVFILGGHTHITLEQPDEVSGIPIFHPGPYGRAMGKLTIKMDVDVGSRENKYYEYRLLKAAG